MIDKTLLEQQALVVALRPLGEAVTEIGMDKPMSAYTRQEVLILIETVVDAWQKHLLDNSPDQSLIQLQQDTRVEEEPF